MITISYIVAMYSPDYIITIMVEIESKNGAGNIYIHAYFEKLPNKLNAKLKMTSDDAHIMYCSHMILGLHNHYHS